MSRFCAAELLGEFEVVFKTRYIFDELFAYSDSSVVILDIP